MTLHPRTLIDHRIFVYLHIYVIICILILPTVSRVALPPTHALFRASARIPSYSRPCKPILRRASRLHLCRVRASLLVCAQGELCFLSVSGLSVSQGSLLPCHLQSRHLRISVAPHFRNRCARLEAPCADARGRKSVREPKGREGQGGARRKGRAVI